MQVFSNEACTQRPQVGQSYSQLWVKISKTIGRDAYYDWGDIDQPFSKAAITGFGDDPGLITVYIDMISDDFEGEIAPGVYSVSSSEALTITAPLVVDFDE